MKSCLLYTKPSLYPVSYTQVNYNSRECYDKPLVVNAAGCTNTHIAHTNENKSGRLDFYFIYLISGTLEVSALDSLVTVNEGELVIIPPKSKYTINNFGEHIEFLCVHFTGSEATSKLVEYNIALFPSVNRLSPKNHMQLSFKTLFDAFAKNDELRERELAILLERLFIETSRAIKSRDVDIIKLSKSIRYINEYFAQGIKIPELAKMEGMCVTAYNKCFKEQMGLSPMKYIISLRISSAIELLETSNLSIKEISSMCGYSNFNFFSRAFKQHTGKTPSQFR